jgi:hypothetical protein
MVSATSGDTSSLEALDSCLGNAPVKVDSKRLLAAKRRTDQKREVYTGMKVHCYSPAISCPPSQKPTVPAVHPKTPSLQTPRPPPNSQSAGVLYLDHKLRRRSTSCTQQKSQGDGGPPDDPRGTREVGWRVEVGRGAGESGRIDQKDQ